MLRDSTLSTYEKTKPELLDKLMKTTTISGRPSLYLQELATLADRIGASEDIVRHIFLQALPKSISPVIASQKDLSIQQIGKLADELLPFLINTQIMAVKPPASTNAQTDQTDGRLNQTNNNSTKYGLRLYKPDQKQKICWAHLYFAERARNCTSWCRWPNKQNINETIYIEICISSSVGNVGKLARQAATAPADLPLLEIAAQLGVTKLRFVIDAGASA